MEKKFKACALILARKNSVRLPNKNRKLFANEPLIFWTINAAKKSKIFERIFCYTDDEFVENFCKKNDVEVSLRRPKIISGSKVSSIQTMSYFFNQLKKYDSYNPEWVTLLQPTSPLRTADHIKESYKLLLKSKCDSLISVKKIKSPLNQIKFISNHKLKNLTNDQNNKKENIDSMLVLYEANGAIYTIKKDKISKINSFLTKKTKAYIMDDSVSIDIDNIKEFELAEKLFKK